MIFTGPSLRRVDLDVGGGSWRPPEAFVIVAGAGVEDDEAGVGGGGGGTVTEGVSVSFSSSSSSLPYSSPNIVVTRKGHISTELRLRLRLNFLLQDSQSGCPMPTNGASVSDNRLEASFILVPREGDEKLALPTTPVQAATRDLYQPNTVVSSRNAGRWGSAWNSKRVLRSTAYVDNGGLHSWQHTEFFSSPLGLDRL